jgi:hypothetical protein
MAKDKGEKRGNGAAVQSASTEVETLVQPETSSPAESTAGDTSAQQYGETTATEAPAQDEPGPEDFARHDSARLLSDHERDLKIQEDVERRIKNRGPVIAERAMRGGARNPVVRIGSRLFTPRKRPEKAGGGIGLAEVSERSEISLP